MVQGMPSERSWNAVGTRWNAVRTQLERVGTRWSNLDWGLEAVRATEIVVRKAAISEMLAKSEDA